MSDVPLRRTISRLTAKELSRKVTIGLLAATPFLFVHNAAAAQVQTKPPDLEFKGRFLLVASDTDMLPPRTSIGSSGLSLDTISYRLFNSISLQEE